MISARSRARRWIQRIAGERATLQMAQEWAWWTRKWVKTPFGFWFVGHPMMQSGEFEREMARLTQSLLAEADLLVDVGANVGYYTCLACSMGRRVAAFEPMPNNLQYLRANLRRNRWIDRVRLFEMAVGEARTSAEIHGDGLGASLISGWGKTPAGWESWVAVDRLDAALGRDVEGRRVLVKIDVEGVEFQTLRGASGLLANRPMPVWIVEINQDLHHPARNPKVLDTFRLFWDRGYDALIADWPPRTAAPGEIEGWIDAGRFDSVSTNWLFAERGRTIPGI